MAILLKQQILAEMIHYYPPYIDVTKAGKKDTSTREAARQMFYDFYAMEFLYSQFGSSYGHLSPEEKQKRQLGALVGAAANYYSQLDDPAKAKDYSDYTKAFKNAPNDISEAGNKTEKEKAFWNAVVDPKTKKIRFDPIKFMLPSLGNWEKIEEPMSGVILPDMLLKNIENLYEEVTREVARKLLQHLRLTLVQELRHLTSHAQSWTRFRQQVVSHYNSNKTISSDDFKKLIAKYLPEMQDHPDTVKRLLIFSRYLSKMTADDGKDPGDVIAKQDKEKQDKEKPQVAPQPEEEPYDIDKDPAAIDISNDPPGPPLAFPEEPEEPEEPGHPNFVKPSWYWEPKELGAPFDPNNPFNHKKKKLHEDYDSGKISPLTIQRVWKAIHKAGLTWEDMVMAYNNIGWGGGYGGPKWGTGVVAFLKLVPESKSHNFRKMAGLIDHIFDLSHNNGPLLDKGGMYISPNDLDRRARISHIARYLPNVSLVVKRMLLLVMKHLTNDPEIQKDIGAVTNSATKPFTPDEMEKLAAAGLTQEGNEFYANIPYKNKANHIVHRDFRFKSHTNGMYSAVDSMDAETEVFKTVDDLYKFVPKIAVQVKAVAASGAVNVKPPSEKELYLNSHTRTKVNAEKATRLFTVCKMGWRNTGKYYKAYFPGDKRFVLYVFTDGTFMTAYRGEPDKEDHFKLFNTFEEAFSECQVQTKNASEYPDQAGAQAAIGSGIATPKTPFVLPKVAPTKEYYLEPLELQALNQFFSSKQNLGIQFNTSQATPSDGMTAISGIIAGGSGTKTLFTIGKKLHTAAFGKPYKVQHYIQDKVAESWTFADWSKAFGFIKQNFDGLCEPVPLGVAATASTPALYPAGNLPPYSTSKVSYKVHAGLGTPPKHTIRLTKEDEDMLKGIGFEPKMINQDVWYIHKAANDTVKFYPNNIAKIIFTSKSMSGAPVVKFTIDKMIQWLHANYNATTTSSPIKTGGKPIPAATPTKSPLANIGGNGVKAGALFDGKITAAGFTWDNATGQYQDGQNSLNIKPDRSSILNIFNGPTQSFKNLPDLLSYLASEYPTQKKNLATSKLLKASHPEVERLKEMLAKGGFKKVGVPPASGKKGIKYANDKNDVVVVYQDQSSSIYVVSDGYYQKQHIYTNFNTLYELNNFLDTYYHNSEGDSLGGLETGEPSVAEDEEYLSEQQISQLGDLAAGYKEIQTGIENLTIAKSATEQVQVPHFILYSVSENKKLLASRKFDNKFSIYKIIENTWDNYSENDSFEGMYDAFHKWLKDNFGGGGGQTQPSPTPGPTDLTEGEKEWVNTFVKGKLPHLQIEPLYDGSLIVSDPNNKKPEVVGINEGLENYQFNPLFIVGKNKEGIYFVISFGEKWGGNSSIKNFKTFKKVQKFIQDHFVELTEMVVATPDEINQHLGEFPGYLTKKGFKYRGPNEATGGGNVYDNAMNHDRLIWKTDGSFLIYYGAPNHKYKELANVAEMMKWFKENYEDQEDVHQKVINLLTTHGYQATELGKEVISWSNQSNDKIIYDAYGVVQVFPGDVSSKDESGVFGLSSMSELFSYLLMKHGEDTLAKNKFLSDIISKLNFHIMDDDPLPDNVVTAYINDDGVKIYFYQEGGFGISHDDTYSQMLDPVDVAYFLSNIAKEKFPSGTPSFLEGKTGDNELDEMFTKLGFEHQGSQAGDILTMVFKNSNGARIVIYDDKSAVFTWASLGSETQPTNNFPSFEELKDFMSQVYGNQLKVGTGKKDFPSNPNLKDQWKSLWNIILDSGFDSTGDFVDEISGTLKKVYKHPNGARVECFGDGKCGYYLPHNPPVAFTQYHILESYLKKIYFPSEEYAKSYYTDLGANQMAYSIRLTEDDEDQMKMLGWVYVSAGESQIPTAYVHKDTMKRVVFFNKGLSPNKDKPIATLYGEDKNPIMDFLPKGKTSICFHEADTIAQVIVYFKANPEKMSDENPKGGKYSVSYYTEVGPDQTNYSIRLKKEHEQILYDHGFVWRPAQGKLFQHNSNFYHNTTNKQNLIFYNPSIATDKPAASLMDEGITVHSWNDIAFAIQFVREKYPILKGGSYSVNYYDGVGPEQDAITIRLTKEDEAKLLKAGYKWVPKWIHGKPNAYVNIVGNMQMLFPNLSVATSESDPNYNLGAMLQDLAGHGILEWPKIADGILWATTGASNDSKMTYNEGHPLINTKFAMLQQAPPHSYDEIVFKYNVTPTPPDGSGTGEIHVSMGGTLKFAVGKYAEDKDGYVLWYIRQPTTIGEKIYTFVTPNNLFNFAEPQLHNLLSFTPIEGATTPQTIAGLMKFESKLGKQGHYLPTGELEKRAVDCGFKAVMTSTKGVVYFHDSVKFYFVYFPHGVFWVNEKGAKESKLHPEHIEKFWDEVMTLSAPEMNSDELDMVFTKALSTTREKLFAKILRMAKRLKGGSLEGTHFHDELLAKGFEFNDLDQCYTIEEIYQAIVVTPYFATNQYHLYWITSDNKINHSMTTNKSKLMVFMGKDGALMQGKDFLGDDLTPSSDDYKTEESEANADLIQLNEHDTALLAKCGFKWTPSENYYYKNAKGDIFKFYNTDKAEWYEAETSDAMDDFKDIPHALKFAVLKYLDKSKGITSEPSPSVIKMSPFSGEDYAKDYPKNEDNVKEIKLNDQDHKVLESMAFMWDEKDQKYVKDVGANEMPALEEAGKKKKKKQQSTMDLPSPEQGEFGFTVGTHGEKPEDPSEMEPWYEVVTAYNTGNAIWEDTDDPNQVSGDNKIFEGTVLQVLEYVYHRWGHTIEKADPLQVGRAEFFDYKNYPKTKTDNLAEDEGLMLNGKDHQAALAQGFEWLPNEHLYNHPNKDQFQVKNNGWTWYFIDGQVGNNTTQESFKIIKKKYKFQPGTALDLAKQKKGEVERVKAKVPTHHKLTTELGYTWIEGIKTYQKGANDYVIFLSNGKVSHSVVMGNTTSHEEFTSDAALLDNLKGTMYGTKKVPGMPWSNFNYEGWGKGEIDDGSCTKKDTIQLIPNDASVMKQLGFDMMYTGDKHEPKFSNVYFNNKGEAVVFHVDGMSHWTREGKEKTSFNSPKAMAEWLWVNQHLKKQKDDAGNFTMSPPKIVGKKKKKVLTGTEDMPWSGTNYKILWIGQSPNTSLALNLLEDETIQKLGWHREDAPGGTVYINGHEMLAFYKFDSAKYWSNYLTGGITQSFPSVEDTLRWLWKNKGSVQKKKVTGEMPYSGTDYANMWKTQGISTASPIRLVAEDEKTLKSLGFVFGFDYNNVQQMYQRGTEILKFFADGKAKYSSGETGQSGTLPQWEPFFTVKDAMQHVWNKHSGFIEEASSYKTFMKKWIE